MQGITGHVTYRKIYECLSSASEAELNMEAMVGLETGLIPVRSFGHVTDATDGEDLQGNTLILETSRSEYSPEAATAA
jgi:hypothetical protein